MSDRYMNFDDTTLIVVFIICFLVSMYIQIDDPEIKVRKPDWIIGFLCSCVGGIIAYKFSSFNTPNPGEVMFWTCLASVASPRAFRFLVNHRTQDRLFNSIFDRITGKSKTSNNDDSRNDG